MARSGSGSGSAERSRRWLLLAMGMVVASFVLATAYSQLLLSSDTDALSIAYNAGPSIVALADARATLTRIERDALSAGGADGAPAGEAARADLAQARQQLDASLAAYLALPEYPGEHARYAAVPGLLGRLDALAAPTGAAGRRRRAAEIVAVAGAIDTVLDQLSEINEEQLGHAARRIPLQGRRANLYAFALDGVGILVALAAWLLVARVFERYVSTLERRGRELEHLAVQIGHEIANPLTPIKIAMREAEKEVQDAATRGLLARAQRAVKRIEESIHGLTTFAMAGLAPADAHARAPLAATLAAAARQAGLAPPPGVDPAWQVACAEPALRELLARFFAAAGDDGARAIEVRAVGRRLRVRVALAAGARAARVGDPFEPQLRERESGQPGIDLRLATVRRLVEAHGGRVGARFGREHAALWLELPRA